MAGKPFFLLLLVGAALASPVLAKDPVFLINTTDRPWRLLGKTGIAAPLAVTKEGKGGTATRQVYPGYDHPTWLGMRGATPKETMAKRNEYVAYFTFDATIPPGQTVQLELAGEDEAVHANFYLCDVNDQAPDHGPSSNDMPLPTLLYSVDRSAAATQAGIAPVRFEPYGSTLPGLAAVLKWEKSNPTVITLVKSTWGALRSFKWVGPFVWSEKTEPWETAAKASGADPVGHTVAWRMAQDAVLKGMEGKGLERKE